MFFALMKDKYATWGCTVVPTEGGTMTDTYPIMPADKPYNFAEMHRFFFALLNAIEDGQPPIGVHSLERDMVLIDHYIEDKNDKFKVFMNHIDLNFWWMVRSGEDTRRFWPRTDEIAPVTEENVVDYTLKIGRLLITSGNARTLLDWNQPHIDWAEQAGLFDVTPRTVGSIMHNIDLAAVTSMDFDATPWRNMAPYYDWMKHAYGHMLSQFLQSGRRVAGMMTPMENDIFADYYDLGHKVDVSMMVKDLKYV